VPSVIVIVGSPALQPGVPPRPAGRACAIALAAAQLGASIELVGRAGDDAAGDALMIALAKAGVGHVALLRDPARPTRLLDASVVPEGVTTWFEDEDDLPLAVGHGTGSRDSFPNLDPADVDLGLRYLAGYSVVVVTDDVPRSVIPAATDAAAFNEAHLVVLTQEGTTIPDHVPATATVLGAPTADPDDTFARLVAAYVVALDRGQPPGSAFQGALAAGWESPAT
jgi:ribokinase